MISIIWATAGALRGSNRPAMISRACALLCVSGVALAACTASSEEVRPPEDALFFPTGIAISPDDQFLFVTSANSDLRYDSGTVLAIDVALVDTAVTAFRDTGAIDPALVLSIVDVDEAGLAGPDWWPSLLQRVADGGGWPTRPRDTLERLRSAPPHANWLLYFVFDKPDEAEERWAWVRFAQRRLASVPREAAPDVEVALRALKEMPVLVLALERLGVADPSVYATVARAARRLSTAGGPEEIDAAMRSWQGALAVLEQTARHRPVPGDVVATLLTSLAAAVPERQPLAPSGQIAGRG